MENLGAELPIAVRVYPDGETKAAHRAQRYSRPEATLVFDCETRTDAAQTLTFGSYRFLVQGRCLQEGLFHADDPSAAELDVLREYVREHPADTVADGDAVLHLLSLSEFLERLHEAAYKGRGLVVAFNFPFDMSRLAYDFGSARGRFFGGFSLSLWSYRDEHGRRRANRYRPRIVIKHIDSKRALKAFTAATERDEVDQIPDGSTTGQPDEAFIFRGHFLDLRTLAFALTDRGYSLESACEAFGVEHGKIKVARHGVVNADYIDYNRRDVLATVELAAKLLAEYDRHPIALQATKAYSPASIGKAYLRAMGIAPILQRQPEFPKRFLGYAQSAFFGGRASAHVRKVPVPVVYTDFLSQYSTVNVLLGLWRFVIAREVKVVEKCTSEVNKLLAKVSLEWLLDPRNWKKLTGFARIIPDGDIIPVRAKYGANDWQIGINHVHADSEDPKGGLWYALPDLAASVLLTGRQPRVVEAFRIVPDGVLETLKPIEFRGQVRIDPLTDDFFKVVIEQRKRIAKATDLSDRDRKLLDKALKTLGSATSYGIFAQMDRHERDDKIGVTCYGIDSEPFECRVTHPESPGEFCFPPLASLITSSGRLLLAMLERSVTDRGGTYAMEDTDSMAIVSTQRGGLIPCRGGPFRTKGQEAIKALSWEEVGNIVGQFARLNPYDREAVRGSVLKIEDDNFDPKTKKQRQLWCYAISAKRYALFVRTVKGPELLREGQNNGQDRWSEHGLGHLLNPTDPRSDDREWIAQVWLRMVRKALGARRKPLPFERVPAVGRVTVSSPRIVQSFKQFNDGKPYAKQIKPFNFLLSAQVQEFGHPVGVDPLRFHLIAPYESNPNKWLRQPWIDEHTARRYHVSTTQNLSSSVVSLKTYGDVLLAYEYHPEVKCAGPSGEPCEKQTVGLLGRRHVKISSLTYIGKESNKLEDVEEGSVTDSGQVYTEYPDTKRDEWATRVLPALKAMPLRQLITISGLSRAALQAIRAGRRPQPKNQKLLIKKLLHHGAIDSNSVPSALRRSPLDVCEIGEPSRQALSANGES